MRKLGFLAALAAITIPPTAAQAERDRTVREKVLQQVNISDWGWERSGFGSVMVAWFQISNESAYEVRDVRVTCRLFGNSGTLLDTKAKTLYERIPVYGSERARKVNLGFIDSQVRKGTCRIVDLVVEGGTGPYVPGTSERETVLRIQRALAERGHPVGTPDGVMGPRTEDAIREYQRAAGIRVDGRPSRELLVRIEDGN